MQVSKQAAVLNIRIAHALLFCAGNPRPEHAETQNCGVRKKENVCNHCMRGNNDIMNTPTEETNKKHGSSSYLIGYLYDHFTQQLYFIHGTLKLTIIICLFYNYLLYLYRNY